MEKHLEGKRKDPEPAKIASSECSYTIFPNDECLNLHFSYSNENGVVFFLIWCVVSVSGWWQHRNSNLPTALILDIPIVSHHMG